jgi:hypothetical protein
MIMVRRKNKEIYGTETPPAYDLSKISAPVGLYYGRNDGLVPYQVIFSQMLSHHNKNKL